MTSIFDLDAIESAKKSFKISQSGFRFGYIPNIIREDVYADLVRTFPNVQAFSFIDKVRGGGRKRFYAGPSYFISKHAGCICHFPPLSESWIDLLKESGSLELMATLSTATGVALNSVCNFGFSYGKEGCVQEPHVDGAVREDHDMAQSTLACLLYFNENPDVIGGTCVYAPDRTTVLLQAPILRNGLFFFEQHPHAWHGFPEMPAGSERRLLSLAYSNEDRPIGWKTSFAHRLTCKNNIKLLTKRFLRSSA